MKYRRNLDFAERSWLASEKQGAPQAYIIVFEGTGDISEKAMEDALCKVSELYPVCRSKITGCLKNLRWEESKNYPRFIRLKPTTTPFSDWPIDEEKNIFWETIDLKKESPFTVYTLSDGRKRRIYLKGHHTSMDGSGVIFMMYDLFKILRGENPVGVTSEHDTKDELFSSSLPHDFFEKRHRSYLTKKKAANKQKKRETSPLLKGVTAGNHILGPPIKDNNFEWRSLSIPIDKINPSMLSGKVISATMDALKKIDPGIIHKNLQASIPVDLRYLKPGFRTASNLTGIIMLELEKFYNKPQLERVSQISNDIKEYVSNHAAVIKTKPILTWIPIRLLSFMTFVFRKIVYYKSKYPCYFFFSNVGRWDITRLSTNSFKTHRIFLIPNMQFYCPLFLVFLTHDHAIEILCATDSNKKALGAFVDHFEKEMISNEIHFIKVKK